MGKPLNFTEFSDEELHSWFKKHIEGWTGYAVKPKENFEAVMAEMQRRYIVTQKEASRKIIDLTDKLKRLNHALIFFTIVILVLTAASAYKAFFPTGVRRYRAFFSDNKMLTVDIFTGKTTEYIKDEQTGEVKKNVW